MPSFLRRLLLVAQLSLLFATFPASRGQGIAFAQETPNARRVTLHGSVHPWARAEFDRGAVPDDFPASRLLLILRRSPQREAALQQFLRSVHAQGSSEYHHWLTPDEFGARFGAEDSEIAAVTGWLQGQGLQVHRVTRGKRYVEFSGTAAQLRAALQTEIHQYALEGKTYFANASEISLPQEIAPLIRGFAPLNNFPLQSYLHAVGPGTIARHGSRVTPQFTLPENGKNFYALGPEDFATQYDLAPVYAAGTNGSGQTIGIVGSANINLSLVDAYRALFSLPGDNTQVVIDGEDPGDPIGANVEGFLDVEVSGAVAPKATINFYVSAGTLLQSGVVLAAMRAVEDNQASVISASFGECELLLGAAGNQLWEGLWEQAAAQGQTVVVSSGDSGPVTCPLLGTIVNGTLNTVDIGPDVNGLASTPWNIAVGGTDFYYSDYASGAASIASAWNAANDASNGSLKASLPEQPWDDALGFNAIAFNPEQEFSIPTPAGGGGRSNCAQSTGTPPAIPTCVSGYSKPGWQNAPGVPPDGARDLPDVSLFAANGANYTAYPICANAGDCTPVASGEPQVFLVGGTSASAPAMAGIMALINQKYGRQGQANFTLYALARQQPGIFHDITIGTNDVLCLMQSSTCNSPVPNLAFLYSYGVYAAGPGYDLASGLGTIDVNALITNWNKASFAPTSTQLQLSPVNVVHGSPVTVTTTVQASSGSTVPSGDVGLKLSSSGAIPQGGFLTLADGAATASVSDFPGGTYQVSGDYEGDGVFAASSSSPITLTVTPEASTTQLTGQYVGTDGRGFTSGPIQAGAQIPFGSQMVFQAQPVGQTSGSTGGATGSVNFADGSDAFQAQVNSLGTAIWVPVDLAIGPHSVTANYSGDASYNASASTPLAFSVVKGTPLITVNPDQLRIGVPSYTAGVPLLVHLVLRGENTFTPPTGSVTVTLGPLTQSMPLTANAYINEGLSTAFIVFPSVPAGTYAFGASYGGDNNWNATSYTESVPLTFVANPTLSPTTLTVSANAATVNTAQSVTFTATLQSTQPLAGNALGTFVNLYANGTAFAGIVFLSNPPSNANTITGTVLVPGGALPEGVLKIVGNYAGGPDLAPVLSGPISLTVTPTDFGFTPGSSAIVIKSGSSANVALQIAGPNGGSLTVQLACTPSSASFACAVNPPAASVTGNSAATLTINAFVPVAQAAQNQGVIGFSRAGGAGILFGFVILLLLPRRRLRGAFLSGLMVCTMALALGSCGGGSSSPPPPPPPQQTNTPVGMYSVLVTGQSAGITHNTKITVHVQ